jgi:hypothetical protein
VTLSDQSPRSGSFQIAIITVIGVPTPTAADIAPRLCPRLANQCDRSEAAHEVRYGCNRPDGCCQSHTGSNDAHKQKRLHWEAPHVIDQMSSRNITSMHVAPQDTESSLRGTSSLFDAYRKEVMPGRQLVPPAPQRIARLWIAPQQSATLCSSASQLLWRSPISRARASSATAPRLPDDRRHQPTGRESREGGLRATETTLSEQDLYALTWRSRECFSPCDVAQTLVVFPH